MFENHPWYGKKVAFLGDSITDACHVGTTENYWQFLAGYLAITPWVYGINGNSWYDMPDQIAKLKAEHGGEVDAIMVFMGTNDFNGSWPLGEWFTVSTRVMNANGETVPRLERKFCMDCMTFRGRLNIGLSLLKHEFPEQQIVLLTPIHRAFAQFSETNVQPPESCANGVGLFVEEYVKAIREAGSLWAVPVIDLFAVSGLYPMEETHGRYFHDGATDRLHPNAAGHKRIAKTLVYQLAALPADFKEA